MAGAAEWKGRACTDPNASTDSDPHAHTQTGRHTCTGRAAADPDTASTNTDSNTQADRHPCTGNSEASGPDCPHQRGEVHAGADDHRGLDL